ncbi:unnamed protein product [Effrenium voratum]|nr:unnamed protein product [Effrenium voratum]
MPRSEEASWKLRQLCSRKGVDVADVLAFMATLSPEERLAAVREGNSNGKTPLHYAAQLRPKGAELCRALLEASAEVDATTRRGHTPLLFAAGRGHGEVVRFLLSAGANCRIVAASGEAPWNACSPHLDEDARAAQLEYEQASLACRARRVEEEEPDGEVALARSIVSALDDEGSEEALSSALVAAAVEDKFALRTAVRMIFSQKPRDKRALPRVLAACREQNLLRELQKRSRRARSSGMSRILTSLFIELRNTNVADEVPVAELVAAAMPDLVLTMEVLYTRTCCEACQSHFRELWPASLPKSKYFGELAWAIVGHQQNQGRQRAFALCRDWVLLLRWAARLGGQEERRTRGGRWTCEHSHRNPGGSGAAPAVQGAAARLPGAAWPRAEGTSSQPRGARGCAEQAPALPHRGVLLRGPCRGPGRAEEARLSPSMMLALDTEWGDCSQQSPPSVIQVAIPGAAWVLDVLKLAEADLRELLHWVLDQEVQLLGFHFASDLPRLQLLVPHTRWAQVRDLQREAMQLAKKKGHTPGLGKLCELYLEKHLDKSLQCSDWDQRPLSAEQIRYAAADAAVLLDLAEAMDAAKVKSGGLGPKTSAVLLPAPEALAQDRHLGSPECFDLVLAMEPLGYLDLSEYAEQLRPFIRRREKEEDRRNQVQLICVEFRERLEDARDELYSAGYYLADHEALPRMRQAVRKAGHDVGLLGLPSREKEQKKAAETQQDTAAEPIAVPQPPSKGGKQFSLDAELARGIPLHHALRAFGRLWKASPMDLELQQRERLWQLSAPVKKFDIFLSHTWHSPGTWKYLALLLQSSCPVVFCVWAFAAALIFGLCMMDILPLPFRRQDDNLPETYPLGCWILLSNLASLVTIFAWPYLPQLKSMMCFLDAVSINQADGQLMEQGVYGIGGFLSISQELRILWTPLYLSRLWCVFEIAMYRKANPTGKITLAPVHLEVTALCLWLTMVILSLVQWSAWVRGVTAQTKIASLVLATVPVGCAIQKLRRSVHTQRQLLQALANFDLDAAGCRRDFDKKFVHDSIEQCYGSTGAFTEYVRGPLREELLASSFGMPLRYYLVIVSPGFCVSLEETVSLMKGQAPWQSVLSFMFARTIGAQVSLALGCQLCIYMCTRFSSPHAKVWVETLRSAAIVVVCTLVAICGVDLSLRVRQFGLGASAIWALLALGATFLSFRKRA